MMEIIKILDPSEFPEPIEVEFGNLYTILFYDRFVPGDKVRIEFDVTEPGSYCLSKVESGKK